MKHYFLDTNVVLDFLARREPFAEKALSIFRAGLEQRATLYVASLSFSTVYYVLRRQTSAQLARSLVADLAKLVTVVAVDSIVVQRSITGPFPDFEDAIQYYAAVSVPVIEAIITRDLRGFTGSLLPAITAEHALSHLSQP